MATQKTRACFGKDIVRMLFRQLGVEDAARYGATCHQYTEIFAESVANSLLAHQKGAYMYIIRAIEHYCCHGYSVALERLLRYVRDGTWNQLPLRTAAGYALRRGDARTVEPLIIRGARYFQRSDQWYDVSSMGNVPVMKLLLRWGKVDDRVPVSYETLLCNAIRAGSRRMVKLILADMGLVIGDAVTVLGEDANYATCTLNSGPPEGGPITHSTLGGCLMCRSFNSHFDARNECCFIIGDKAYHTDNIICVAILHFESKILQLILENSTTPRAELSKYYQYAVGKKSIKCATVISEIARVRGLKLRKCRR